MSTIGYNDTVRFSAPSRPVRAARPEPMQLTRRGRLFFGTVLALIALAVAYFLGAGASQAGADSTVSTTSFEQVTVMPGDTLWSIATNVAPNADTQSVIAEIVSLNQLETATVQPGQRLAIPAEYLN
jgi:nucleoid-associated protein YgaU